jgi:hypothetical protein
MRSSETISTHVFFPRRRRQQAQHPRAWKSTHPIAASIHREIRFVMNGEIFASKTMSAEDGARSILAQSDAIIGLIFAVGLIAMAWLAQFRHQNTGHGLCHRARDGRETPNSSLACRDREVALDPI